MDIIERLRKETWSGFQSLAEEAGAEIERLRGGYKRLRESSDLEMQEGDLARDIADEMLTPNNEVSSAHEET